MLLLSLCLKDSTDVEFLVSSGRLFQTRVVEGRILGWNTAKAKLWNGIGWYGFIGPTTSTTDISLM